MSKLTLVESVASAKKPAKKPNGSGGGGGGSGGAKVAGLEFGDYKIIGGAFHQVKKVKDRESGKYVDFPIQLCDFVCKITEEITQETGLEEGNFLKIQATRADSMVFPEIEVSSSKFFATTGNWINESYGSRLFIYPGATKREHLRACIQQFSTLKGDVPRRHVYTFSGWKKINEHWHYLTGSGAINAEGLRADVSVNLGQNLMSRYSLPTPLAADAIPAAVKAVFDLLAVCPGKRHIGAALLAALARAPLGECHPVDFCLFIHGYTGTKKSSITSIALSFFGEFGGGLFPANWSDTDNDMESKSFQAKDAIFVVDDFKPSVNSAEAARLHSKSERFIRNTGNRAGRGRRNNDMSAKAAPYNRSMTIITGEDLPRGQSLLGRLLILELLKEDVCLATLTRLQHAAREGLLAGLMSSYLQWLAPRIDAYKKQLPPMVLVLRDECIHSGLASSHPRAPDIYSNLVAGAGVFFDFLLSTQAITPDQAVRLSDDLNTHLKQAFSEQATYQQEQDDCERFLSLLRALFSSGNAHISCRLKQGPPNTRPHNWGWNVVTVEGVEAVHTMTEKPNGDCLGWYDDKERQVLMNQEAVFAAVQQLARNQGDAFLLSSTTLWRRMGERGLIIKFETRENGSKQWTVKRSIGGSTKRVMVLSADLVEGFSDKDKGDS